MPSVHSRLGNGWPSSSAWSGDAGPAGHSHLVPLGLGLFSTKGQGWIGAVQHFELKRKVQNFWVTVEGNWTQSGLKQDLILTEADLELAVDQAGLAVTEGLSSQSSEFASVDQRKGEQKSQR